MHHIRWQQPAGRIDLWSVLAKLLQRQMTGALRIATRSEIVQNASNVVWIEQPHNVHTGQHGFAHNFAVLLVLGFAILVHAVPTVFT